MGHRQQSQSDRGQNVNFINKKVTGNPELGLQEPRAWLIVYTPELGRPTNLAMAGPLPGAGPSPQRAEQNACSLQVGWPEEQRERKEMNYVSPFPFHKFTNQTNHRSPLGVRPHKHYSHGSLSKRNKTREEASTLNTLSVSIQAEQPNHLSFSVQRPFNTGNWFHRR